MGINDALSNRLQIKNTNRVLLVYKFYTPISQVFLDLNVLKQVTNFTTSISAPLSKVLSTKLNYFNNPYFSSKYIKNSITLNEINTNTRIIFIKSLVNVLKLLHNYIPNGQKLKIFNFKTELKKFWILLNTKNKKLYDLYKQGLNLAMKIEVSGLQKNLCHNDLVNGNILWSKNQIKLIDFDFSSINYRLFDICSFISENKLTNQEKQLFLKLMNINKNEMKCLKEMIDYQNILWSFWALYYFKHKKTNIYWKIAIKKAPIISSLTLNKLYLQ